MCSVVGHMMGKELVEFPSATNGRGVLIMVIACGGRTMGNELRCSRRLLLGEESIIWLNVFTKGEESIRQDYERDRLIGLDHE